MQLGPQHTDTLTAKNNLAVLLENLGERDEARRLFEEVIKGRTTLYGPQHTHTLKAKMGLAVLLKASAPLPAGARVLVQRLVAKPEHNGKRARVLSFDVPKGRYVVALDDGKELSLKAECVAKMG